MENMGVDPSFWSDRRVFLTGHTGFKGGWLAHWLKAMGAKVTGFALDPEGDVTLFDAADIGSDIIDIRANVQDVPTLQTALDACEPQTVFHLAAQPLVRASYEDPVDTFQTNLIGSINLLEALRTRGAACQIVNVTTDKCYLNREWIWPYREDEPMGGHDPYSASKACVELATDCYRKSFFHSGDIIRLASARAGNVIGGGDWAADRIVPDLMRGFAAGETVLLRNPKSVRPWQHVLDALNGYLILAQRLASPDGGAHAEAYNFGPDAGDEMDVAAIAALAQQVWGPGARVEAAQNASGPHEANTLKLDSTKARQSLGWRPQYDMEQCVRETVTWYQAFYAGETVGRVMDKQIASFLPSA